MTSELKAPCSSTIILKTNPKHVSSIPSWASGSSPLISNSSQNVYFGQPILLTSVLMTGLLLGAKQVGWLVPLELHVYDSLIRLQPQQESDPRLLIVGITDEDIQAQQQWPLSDQVLAQAINQLQQYQPKVIGIDLYRDIDHPPGQAALAKQFAANNVVELNPMDMSRHQRALLQNGLASMMS